MGWFVSVDYYFNLFLLHNIMEKYCLMGDINEVIRLESFFVWNWGIKSYIISWD